METERHKSPFGILRHRQHLTDPMDAWTRKATKVSGYIQECYDASVNWLSLSSFFESHGYFLYDYPSLQKGATPPKVPQPYRDIAASKDPYPYARLTTSKDEHLAFYFIHSMRVWPARDAQGREVIFRLVAPAEESDEFEVYKRLNTPQARQDPRNHTIPVLQWLEHGGLVFVVMPRWDIIALARPQLFYRNVSELFAVAEILFEGLSFLHEKRIAHRDIFETNVVMNAIVDVDAYYYDLRDPAQVRYAYIDYDNSIALPEDTDTNKASVPRLMGAQNCYMRVKEGPCNPFKDDVRALSYTLERSMRHIEDAVPEVGPFFEELVRGDENAIPAASKALEALRNIRSQLSRTQLDHAPTGLFWYPDRVKFLKNYEEAWEALSRFRQNEAATLSST